MGRYLACLFAALLLVGPAHAVRVKDLGAFLGDRINVLTGTGLVVGLNRTGDSQRNKASVQALVKRLQGMGYAVDASQILSRNVALVAVTAELSTTHRTGVRLDVVVASVGDATSLEGGTLLVTPLKALDNRVHAVAQGNVTVGGYQLSSGGDRTGKNITTTGRVEGGAIVELETGAAVDYNSKSQVEFVLDNPDFTTANRTAIAINEAFDAEVARARDAGTIVMTVPLELQGRFPEFAARIEAVDVTPDSVARVVINERTGTVVMGSRVTIGQCAVSHGGLQIEVQSTVSVSQPGPFSQGQTVAYKNSQVKATEEPGAVHVVEGTTLNDLAAALNSLNVKPRDLITILQMMQAQGCLHAELVVQ
jgi:flagellar P-ring protein precursor FlgI